MQHPVQTSGCSNLARIGPLVEAKSYKGPQSSSNSTSQMSDIAPIMLRNKPLKCLLAYASAGQLGLAVSPIGSCILHGSLTLLGPVGCPGHVLPRAKTGSPGGQALLKPPVHLVSAYLALAKSSHVAKPNLNGVGTHCSPGGASEGRECLLLTDTLMS